MLVYTSYSEAMRNSPYCIALGNFDGIHIGHYKLIESTILKAKELECKSMIYTFKEHSKKILSPNTQTEKITDERTRMEIFENGGIDSVFLENFSHIKNMEAEEFINEIFIKKLKIKCIVAGYDFKFGSNQKGNIDTLKIFGKKYGFDVFIIEPIIIDQNIVSSSIIRKFLKNGEMEKASKYLGRFFTIEGKVIHGKKRGSKIGIRTANIEIGNDIVVPKNGVYYTDTIIDSITYKSITNIGYNPTFNEKKISLETHIIDFDKYIYDACAKVIFYKWHRKEKAFNTINELKQQIDYDINNRLAFNI